jgi:hypothetical protein
MTWINKEQVIFHPCSNHGVCEIIGLRCSYDGHRCRIENTFKSVKFFRFHARSPECRVISCAGYRSNGRFRRFLRFTPTLQKSRMPQILGVEGEAVVLYREPSTTKEMRYPRLSRRVNKMAAFSCFQNATCSELQQGIENEKIACIHSL